MFTLSTKSLQMRLHAPDDGFYQGTRFDHGGVWDSLLFKDIEICGRWFASYDPRMHDAVCGPAEEFSPVFLEGGRILKIGVGILQADDAPYDRFRLYSILDGGSWTVEAGEKAVLFRHRLPGYYEYEKEVVLTGEASFEIRHQLRGSYEGEVYNHNFFTMGMMAVSPSRRIDFPFTPAGSWRAAYDSVGFTAGGVRFSRALEAGESVFSGDIHEAGTVGMPYAMTLRETLPERGALSVHIRGSVPVSHTVLWANHRIACLEPYNRLSIGPDAPARWTLTYALECADSQPFVERCYYGL